MRILVTGAAGFIGSNYVRHVLALHPDMHVTVLDALTYAGNMENLTEFADKPNFRFIKGDISSADDVANAFASGSFDAVLNFAAETHVDRSLQDVGPFIQTNIRGVQLLLDASRKNGVGRFLQVSTDEVYGSLGPEGRFSESTPVQPNNPYAATKAAADFLVRAAHKSHGMDVVITRCSNNFGPYQFPEKLIPLMIANALENKPLPVYGDGMHVRDWIYVMDHCSAVDTVLTRGKAGEVYNIGGNHDVPNLEIVRTMLRILKKPESLIKYVSDRPGHDRRYAIDCSKIHDRLGWKPSRTFETAMDETIKWYLGNLSWLQRVRSGQYMKYYDEMYGTRLSASGEAESAAKKKAASR